MVNAAGLYADKIAKSVGFSERFCVFPFKELYLYSEELAHSLRANIYPVPDLRNPFLRVHLTLTSSGKMKIGPTAIPAFWREHYGRLQNFSLKECLEVTSRGLGLLGYAGFEFRRLAMEEVLKYSRRRVVQLAGELLEGVRLEQSSIGASQGSGRNCWISGSDDSKWISSWKAMIDRCMC